MTRSPKVLLNDTSMVPNVSFAGIMKEILAILRMIPAENRISDISSGSGTQLDVQSTVIKESFIKSNIVAVNVF